MDPSLTCFSGAVYDLWAFLQASVRPDEPAVFAKPSANQLTVSGQACEAPQEAAEVVQLKDAWRAKGGQATPEGYESRAVFLGEGDGGRRVRRA